MTSGPSSLGFYVYGIMLLLVCAMKLPALARRPRDMLLRAACLLLFAAGLLMIFAAPASISALNRTSGTANFAALVVYATTTAFSGASLLLIVNWRPAPAEQTRRISRMCVGAYSLAVLLIAVLFWAGNAPVPQPTLFDAYYATTPYIREMIVLYLTAQGVAMAVASILCWRWSRQVRGSLKAGLTILAAGYLMILCYDAMRLVAVGARWTGQDLDFLVDEVSVLLSAPACILGALGFVLPLAGPRIAETLRAVRQLRRLAPLWRALGAVPTPGAVRAELVWWRTPPALLLTGRKTALYDAILALAPYCDPAVREAAHRAALHHGLDSAQAAVTADTVMILTARDRRHTAPDELPEVPLAAGWPARDLIPLSRSLASPVVHRLQAQYADPEKAAHHE
ncbi:MAB_1171c family putative transporter [Streptomyces sp. NPDC088387]|uniref:MAB_1171c family putative transporter n=1 Tax=Streptomyces sp. NPDC088387 TaxID=3365859 RepID=UPI003802410C